MGDDLECTDRVWQKLNSVAGSCAYSMCPMEGTDADADHPPDAAGSDSSECQASLTDIGGECPATFDGSLDLGCVIDHNCRYL